MNTNDILGEAMEKGQGVIKKTGKAAADSAAGVVKTAVGQVAGDSGNQAGANETNAAVSDQQTVSDKAQTEELVKELYAPSKPQNAKNPQSSQNPASAKSQPKPEEQARLASIRQKLHDEVYYEPLIQGQKARQEERPAEKVEKEKKQELQDLQQKEAKKPPPIAVQRAQQTAEKFRGVSG
ncbi:MAG: hypothetical protein M1444_04200 [Patescibacteria group bacterium]|nr:hypothetical protein [Patescibacteria group bacterium]